MFRHRSGSLIPLLALLACGDDGTEPAVPTSLSITPGTVSLAIGGSAQLDASILDQRGSPVQDATGITWSSLDTMRVTVDASGLVRGVRPGNTTITASSGSLSNSIMASVLSPQLVVDQARAVTMEIPPTGGEIEVLNADGVRFQLQIPRGALLDTTDVTLTPVSSISNSPFEALLGAVRFAPDGLELLEPATLTITLTSAPPAGLRLIGMSDDGSDFGYAIGRAAGSVITMAIPHFSAGGAVRINPSDPPRPTNSSAERNAISAIQAELQASNTESRPVDLQLVEFWMTDWYLNGISDGLTAAAQSESAFKRGISAWRYWLGTISTLELTLGGALTQAMQPGINAAAQLAASAFSAQIQRSNEDCFTRQNTVPTKDIFYIQYAAEAWNLVGLANGLDRASVLTGLCPRVVFPMASLPDPLDEGQEAQLDVQVGVTFERTGTASIRTGPAWPVSLQVTRNGTTSDGTSVVAPDNNGDHAEKLTAGPSANMTVNLNACMDVDVTPPDMLDFTDVCGQHFVSSTVVPQGPTVVYETDFSSAVGPEWSTKATAVSPSGERFLGEFDNAGVTLDLGNLPAHTKLKVELDLYIIASWDGSNTTKPGNGPDVVTASVDGATLLNTTFSNVNGVADHRQAYPENYPNGSNDAGTGASAINSLGYTAGASHHNADSTYRLVFEVNHTKGTVVVELGANGLTPAPDEFWGIDNVRVTVTR